MQQVFSDEKCLTWHAAVHKHNFRMESIRRKNVLFDNLDDFSKHLMRSRHITQMQNVSSLCEESARVNSATNGEYPLTNFLRPKSVTLGSQSCYESLEFKEIVTLVEEAIRHGTRNYTNRPSRKEIIYSFNTCIGVYCSFKNGRDDSQGYEIKELNTITVVYQVLREDDFSIKVRLITAYPLWKCQSQQQA